MQRIKLQYDILSMFIIEKYKLINEDVTKSFKDIQIQELLKI